MWVPSLLGCLGPLGPQSAQKGKFREEGEEGFPWCRLGRETLPGPVGGGGAWRGAPRGPSLRPSWEVTLLGPGLFFSGRRAAQHGHSGRGQLWGPCPGRRLPRCAHSFSRASPSPSHGPRLAAGLDRTLQPRPPARSRGSLSPHQGPAWGAARPGWQPLGGGTPPPSLQPLQGQPLGSRLLLGHQGLSRVPSWSPHTLES